MPARSALTDTTCCGKQQRLPSIFAGQNFPMVSFLSLCCYVTNRMFQFSFSKVFDHAARMKSKNKFEQ